jgi:hypothetical protein
MLRGMMTMLVSTFGMIFLVVEFQVRTYISMSLFAVISALLWILLLKKEVHITYKSLDIQIFKKTLLLVIIPLFALIYFAYSGFNSTQTDVILLMFVTSLATGIYEEFLFRGVVLGSMLASKMTSKKSILFSAMLFSILHLFVAQDYELIDVTLKLFNTFILGVILAYIYYAVGNILYVMGIHTLWDFVSFVSQQYPLDNMILVITIILFAMSVLYFSWTLKRLQIINE